MYNRSIVRVPVRDRHARIEKDVMSADFGQEGVRIEVLRRLAEQAMSDLEFRAVARHDLEAALTQFGYDLNEAEMSLVLKFRAVLEEAGLDLFLTGNLEDHRGDLLALAGFISPNP
jgi:hypothetical protein